MAKDFHPRRLQDLGQWCLWLELPEPWTSDEFANLARNNGVTVVSGSQFLPERNHATCGVRIALMSPSRQKCA